MLIFDKEGTKTYAMRLKEELCTVVNATKQYQQLILSTSLSRGEKILLILGKTAQLNRPDMNIPLSKERLDIAA